MSTEVGKAYVGVEPSIAGFAGKVSGLLGVETGAGGIFSKIGKGAGLAFSAGLVGAVAIGGGLFAVGTKFEHLFNGIRVQTGATGATFNKLEQDAKNVLSGTAGSFDQVQAAVAGLYQRTHLLGKPLDDLAKKEVTLGRITKTDVGQNVEQTTGLFNKYGVAVSNQSRELDVLFKASQQGGAGFNTLVGSLQAGGAALQQFGFSLDQSASLIASLERAGVNVQPVLFGMRTAFAKLAKEGKDPKKVLADMIELLRSGKTPTLAMADAIKLFGARGGVELATAIRAGRFDTTAMLKTITDGKGGIIATGTEVSTLGSKFARLKNMALVALQPIASKFVDLANHGLGLFITAIQAAGPIVARAWHLILAGFQSPDAKFGAVSGLAKAMLTVGQVARKVADDVAVAFHSINFSGIFATIGPALAQAFTAVKSFDFAGLFSNLFAIVKPAIGPVTELGRALFSLGAVAFPALAKVLPPIVAGLYVAARVAGVVLGGALKVLAVGVQFVSDHFSAFKPILLAAAGAFVAFKAVQGTISLFNKTTKAASDAVTAVKKFGTGIADSARGVKSFGTSIAGAPSKISALFKSGSDTLRLRFMYAKDALSKLGSSLKTGITSILQWGKDALIGAVNTAKLVVAFIAQKAAAIGAAVAQKAMAAAQWLLNAAMDANPIGLVVTAIAALTAGVVLAYQHFGPFRAIVDATFSWIKSHWPLLLAILTGPVGVAVLLIVKNWSKITGVFSGVIDWIKGHWPLILAVLTGPIGLAVLAISKNWDRITGFVSGAISFVRDHWKIITAILTGPIGLAVLAISHSWETIAGGFTAVKNWIGDRIDDIVGFFTGMPKRISTAAANMWDGIKDAFKAVINTIIGWWNGLQFTLPKINVGPIHIGGQTFGVPQITPLAAGGIVKRPTVTLLGEAGPEAVVPLKGRLSSGLELGAFPAAPMPISNIGSLVSHFERIAADAITTAGVHPGTSSSGADLRPIEQHNHYEGIPTDAAIEAGNRKLALTIGILAGPG